MSDHCMIIAVFIYHLIAYQVVLECLPHALKQAPKDALLYKKTEIQNENFNLLKALHQM